MSSDPTPLKTLTVSHAKNWKPATFDQQALEWQLAAQDLRNRMVTANSTVDGSHGYWTGESGDAMRTRFAQVNSDAAKAVDALTAGAAAARAAASDISSHRVAVVNKVTDAEANNYGVAEDGTVNVTQQQWNTLAASVGALRANRVLTLLQDDAKHRTTELQAALKDLQTADVRAESAIHEAFQNLPTPPDFGPPRWVQAIPKIPANDATVEQNRHWWNSLTSEQQADMIASHPNDIGNRDGIPADARDKANRNRLEDLRTEYETAQRTTAAQVGTDNDGYKAITTKLKDLDAVEKALEHKPDQPDRKLLLLDMSGKQTKAAIAVGDPDKADHISVTTPGLNTTVHGSIGNMANEAESLQKEAVDQLNNAGRGDQKVSTIAWIGYETPQTDVPKIGDAAAGYNNVARDDLARAGAVDLSRFYNGLDAASTNETSPHITAVGHSYGSLTTGLALQQPGGHPVTDMVVYGSPGIEANGPEDLGLKPGHGYVMRADNDPISWAQDGPKIAETPIPGVYPTIIPTVAHGAEGLGYGDFGPDPARNSNFTQLDTHAGFTATGRWAEGATGHSEYPQLGSDGKPRMTEYNIAAIVAGLPENKVPVR